MKSIANQYRDLKEGKISQANFMRNLRMSFPQYITNVTSFDDSIKILKNKGILTEAIDPREMERDDLEEFAQWMKDNGADYDQTVTALEDEKGLNNQYANVIASSIYDKDDEEFAALIKKIEDEEKGKQDVLAQWDESLNENFNYSPFSVAELVAQKYGKDLEGLSGMQKQEMALSLAYNEILNSGLPKAKIIARNVVWGYSDEDWPMEYISTLYDIIGRENMEEASYKMGPNAKPVYTLKKGDIMGSGEEVISVSAGISTPKGKMDVTLKDPTTGKTRTSTWGKHTKVNVKKLDEAKLNPNQVHPHELRMGIKVELEHTNDVKKAEKIALDHLAENPFYYTALKLSGIESPSASKVKTPKEVKKEKKKKDETTLIDKENQMKTPKGVEKIKASANKANKETNKATSGIQLMSLVAKTSRGVKKMNATGEKWKKIKMAEARLNMFSDEEPNEVVKQAMDYVNSNPTLKALGDKIEFQQSRFRPDQALLRYDYWDILPKEAAEKLSLQFNIEPDSNFDEDTGTLYYYFLTPKHKGSEKDLGASFDKFKSQLEEVIYEVLDEMYDGGPEDLAAMTKSSNVLRHKPETQAIAKKAAEQANNKEEAASLAVKLAKDAGITDSEQITHIIDLAASKFIN